MEELKVNQEKCYVDKRKLIFDCEIDGKNYVFSYDAWDWNKDAVEKLEVDGKPSSAFKIISAYKHCLQAYFDVFERDGKVFIDRRYDHNSSYNVYFFGKHYLIGTENRLPPKNIE